MHAAWEMLLRGAPFSFALVLAVWAAPALLWARLEAVRRALPRRSRLAARVRSHLEQADLPGAILLAEASEEALAPVLRGTLDHALDDFEQAERACDRAVRREQRAIPHGVGTFRAWAMAAMATGALGTLSGWIVTYTSVAHADPILRRAALVARIHDSLYCLLLGVAVAAIFVACGGYARAAVERGHARLRAEAMEVLAALVRMRRHLRLGDARATMKLDTYRGGLE